MFIFKEQLRLDRALWCRKDSLTDSISAVKEVFASVTIPVREQEIREIQANYVVLRILTKHKNKYNSKIRVRKLDTIRSGGALWRKKR